MPQTTIIKKWYKQTEMWIIPEDWDIKLLPVVLNFIHGKAHEQYIVEDGKYEVVNSKFISSNARIKKFSNQNFCMARTGDILTVLSDLPNGKALAKCFYVADNNKYAVNQRVCVWRSKGDDQKYLYYILNRNKYFLDLDDGVSQTHILNHHILKCPLVVPSERKEQAAIASVLSDTDELIEHLENLITKKKAIKQGAMQQLLSGKKRLPGLSGKWEVKSLWDVAEIVGGWTPSTFVVQYWNGTINWFTPTEIGISKFVYGSSRKITKEGFINSSSKMLPIGTVLLTTRAGIGDVSILKCEGCTNQGFQSLIAKDGYYNEYLYYLMQTLKNILIQNASGSTFLEISPNKIKQIEVAFPDFEEQTAIANVLADMDQEIEFLEKKRDKYRDIKQGMRQQLLTGNIRIYGNK